MSELVTQLSEPLFNAFQSETFVLLSTVDVETGGRPQVRSPGCMR
ncbi:hypothetical protein RE628_08640 [Paenibacillus sp. D2_2]|nr:hypothetical protein [Paenibacillus sp. D2_2]WMT42418.1 hypothetical protein RE628_08640 [Paenibacillus sp. D2_2]